MPQVFVIYSRRVANRQMDLISLGKQLMFETEQIFDIEDKKDTAFTAIQAGHVIHEKDIQVEIRYTVGEDEYGQGKPFNPSKKKKGELAVAIKKEVERMTGINPSVWIKPTRDSVFLS